MAQKVTVQLVDDLDGTTAPDVSTVLFGLDGVTYEIDLTDANAQRLREVLVDYVDAARRVGGRVKRGTQPRSARNVAGSTDAAQIREWALANGFELAGRGRIPRHVVEAYQRAKSESNAAPTRQPRSRKPAKTRTRTKKN